MIVTILRDHAIHLPRRARVRLPLPKQKPFGGTGGAGLLD